MAIRCHYLAGKSRVILVGVFYLYFARMIMIIVELFVCTVQLSKFFGNII